MYEVAWSKVLTVQFGASAWSIAAVVASFMAGLGIGSAWGGRRAADLGRPLLVYGALEVGIALFGFASLAILGVIDEAFEPIYLLLEGSRLLQGIARFVVSFVVLLPPTFLMGASLPVLATGVAVVDKARFRQAIGLLYGINTLGAALGVVAAGFYLLPRWGLSATVSGAAAAGIAIGLVALVCDRRLGPPAPVDDGSPSSRSTDEAAVGTVAGDRGAILLAALFLTGGLGIFLQIAWTRLLAPIVGSSTYAFSIILATQLIGIALGGLAAGTRAFGRIGPRPGVGGALALAALAVLGGLFAVGSLPGWFRSLASTAEGSIAFLFLAQGLICGALILIPAWAMGLALPLAIVAYRDQTGRTGLAIGRVYALNTLGGIVGSIASAFVCLPLWGAPVSILGAAGVCLVAALAVLASASDSGRGWRLVFGAVVVGAAVGMVVLRPEVDQAAIHGGHFRGALTDPADSRRAEELVSVSNGLSSTVLIYRSPDETTLVINGKADASLVGDLTTQYLVGHLPLFLAGRIDRVCIVGYGSGATVRAVASHPVESIDVCELEPAVLAVASAFLPINDRVEEDDRVAIHLEDGRSFLRYRPGGYDVIISEPSNPWIAGIASLFTVEYYELALSRLSEGGVFCQWIQAYEVSSETLMVMLRTLGHVFDHVLVFYRGGDMICLASSEPLGADPVRTRALFENPDVRATLSRIDVHDGYGLFLPLVAELPRDEDLIGSGPLNTDDNLWLEYRAPIEMYRGATVEIQGYAADVFLERSRALFHPTDPVEDLLRGLAAASEASDPLLWSSIAALADEAPTIGLADELRSTVDRMRARVRARRDRNRDLAAARVALDEGRPDGAVALLERHVGGERVGAPFDRTLGEALRRAGRTGEARTRFEAALAVAPFDFVSMVALAELDAAAGRPDEARRRFARALEWNPSYVATWAAWLAFLDEAGEPGEAEAARRESGRRLGRSGRRALAAALAE